MLKFATRIDCLPPMLSIALVMVFAGVSFAQATGAVCGKPSAECRTEKFFQPNDLTFRLPAKMKWQTNYTSNYFYAVILQSRRAVKDEDVDSDKCSQGYFSESERLRAQRLFQDQKVFTSRNGCYGAWGTVYTNINADYEFIAAFGGITQAQAEAVRIQARSNGFKDAYIKRMQIIYQYGD